LENHVVAHAPRVASAAAASRDDISANPGYVCRGN
jgi:hypothetical protein